MPFVGLSIIYQYKWTEVAWNWVHDTKVILGMKARERQGLGLPGEQP